MGESVDSVILEVPFDFRLFLFVSNVSLGYIPDKVFLTDYLQI